MLEFWQRFRTPWVIDFFRLYSASDIQKMVTANLEQLQKDKLMLKPGNTNFMAAMALQLAEILVWVERVEAVEECLQIA